MAAPRIWVLADDRAGNRAQCIGIAERLGMPFDIKEIRYHPAVLLPNMLRGRFFPAVSAIPSAPWPDMVIAAGRRSAPLARYIRHKSGGHTKLVHCLWPEAGILDFDCIVLPTHDDESRAGANIFRVLGAPHLVTRTVLWEASQQWSGAFGHLPLPRVALLVGGGTKDSRFDEGDYHRLGQLAAETARRHRGTVLATTSRRTGAAGERVLLSHILNLPHYFHSWQSMSSAENPYMGYLGLADAIIVTADSIAMCSEACASGKPVYVFEPKEVGKKHRQFLNTLYQRGYARPLREDTLGEWFCPPAGKPLDAAQEVADYIREKIFKRMAA